MGTEAAMRREQVAAGQATEGAAKPVIEVEDLSLTYETADGPVLALAEVSLTLRAGDFVSFIGTSGYDTTTLLRAIDDLEGRSSGGFPVNGRAPEGAGMPRSRDGGPEGKGGRS